MRGIAPSSAPPRRSVGGRRGRRRTRRQRGVATADASSRVCPWWRCSTCLTSPTGRVRNVVASCSDPFIYLRDVIERVSIHPMSRVAELTPREWKRLREVEATSDRDAA